MGHISLTRDPRTTLFTVPAFVVRSEVAGAAPDPSRPFVHLEFYVDTGSNETIIAQTVTDELGIDLSHLPRGPVAGIGGFTASPILNGFPFYLPETSGPYRLQFSRVSVMEDRLERDVVRERGMKRGRERRLSGVSLFGLDALDLLKATLTVQPHAQIASIDWE